MEGEQIPESVSSEPTVKDEIPVEPINSGVLLETRFARLENRSSEIEKQLRTIKDNQPSKLSIRLGVLGGVLGIIGGLVSIPKSLNEANRAIHPHLTTVNWGQEIEFAYTPNQLAFTLDLVASNDGDETDQIDTVSAELKSQQISEPIFITKDDIRLVQTNQSISDTALRTPLSLAAKQPRDLRIAAVVTASSDAVLTSSEPQILDVSITFDGSRTVNKEYCTPAFDEDDRKALRDGKPRRALIEADSRTYARVGDIAEGVKVADRSGSYVLDLKPEAPSNKQGQNLVVFFKDARRFYDVGSAKRSCGPPIKGWVRVEEKSN
jgi:hypothetical protein